MPQHSYVVLPLEGSPFNIKGLWTEKDKTLSLLRDAVGGHITLIPSSIFRIHHSFIHENPRWRLADRLRTLPNTVVYCNENGVYDCSPNMATILTVTINSGCPHLWGDVVLKVSHNDLKKAGLSVESLTFSPDDGRFAEN